MLFSDLGLEKDLLRAISDLGYDRPTPIQQQAIPAVLQGKDVLASAQTGTGKTASFTLPLLQLIHTNRPDRKHRNPRALIITPTRELADQVKDSVAAYGKYLPLRSIAIYGGVSISPQIEKLRQGIDILVATPGRLLDHLNQKTIDLSQIEIFVLDECDRMLDMGFIRDIRKILTALPRSRRTLLFSATFSNAIQKLANSLLESPIRIEVAPRNTAAERVDQVVHPVDRSRKRELLSYMIGYQNWRQVLVFVRTKHGADRLAKQLTQDGLKSAAIHGNKSQAARTRALVSFKQEKFRVLVATDVASRGLDIDSLPYVVNFDLPNVPEDYIHRIGRTGRAGQEGKAVSLVCPEEYPLLQQIERLLKRRIAADVVPGYELTDAVPPKGSPPQGKTTDRKPDSNKKRRVRTRRAKGPE